MTTIAWDGRTLAIDRQVTSSGMAYTGRKARRIGNAVVAVCGQVDAGIALMDWYERGADPERWPSCQIDHDRNAHMIVIVDGRVFWYSEHPIPEEIIDPVMAWGSGREYALGAMAKGAGAVEAVEIACRYDIYSGMGVDSFAVEPKSLPPWPIDGFTVRLDMGGIIRGVEATPPRVWCER